MLWYDDEKNDGARLLFLLLGFKRAAEWPLLISNYYFLLRPRNERILKVESPGRKGLIFELERTQSPNAKLKTNSGGTP
jgi:hypothetical protein